MGHKERKSLQRLWNGSSIVVTVARTSFVCQHLHCYRVIIKCVHQVCSTEACPPWCRAQAPDLATVRLFVDGGWFLDMPPYANRSDGMTFSGCAHAIADLYNGTFDRYVSVGSIKSLARLAQARCVIGTGCLSAFDSWLGNSHCSCALSSVRQAQL